ncbi:sporangiospore maturation cell wall hydrolase GsmA [Dactylosporangium aurantiacum]|uniref:sporangiospore maturation cell wall hydrolase GsmA n=1 Tax=Dactylosporangium aurantiacum TaxID=35754 RepID=UPI000B068C99|nr:sporangiospore maturation cell wall hydrolase GsmA [Dactylosporangium aurantiacum]MDG6110477.1 sporangiospore maturation cell wall hydrolase GsmA [Dactylosporangium aurantiacum]
MLAVEVAPAEAAVATVRVSGKLNVRSAPTGYSSLTRYMRNNQKITVTCRVTGQYVRGKVRRTAQWDRTMLGDWVSHAYVAGNPRLPVCAPPPPPPQPAPPPVVAAPVAVPMGPIAKLTPVQFLAKYGPSAQQSQRDTGVPASVTLAQAILESGWGSSGLTAQHNNFFGMKCFNNNPGSYASGCASWATTECAAGVCYPTTASFRTYPGAAESFRDHGMALKTLARYAPAFQYTNNPNQFAAAVHKGGYATDPLYTDKLVGIMIKYNLYQYDVA